MRALLALRIPRAHGAAVYQLIAREPGLPGFWVPPYSLPSVNAAGTVAFSANGVFAGTSSTNLTTYEPGQVGRTYGHPVLNDQGVIAFWRQSGLTGLITEIVFGTPSQRFTIPASLSPPFPPNSGFVGYDLARTVLHHHGRLQHQQRPEYHEHLQLDRRNFPDPRHRELRGIRPGHAVSTRRTVDQRQWQHHCLPRKLHARGRGEGGRGRFGSDARPRDRRHQGAGSHHRRRRSCRRGPDPRRRRRNRDDLGPRGPAHHPRECRRLGFHNSGPAELSHHCRRHRYSAAAGRQRGPVALNRNGIVAFTAERPSINTFRGIYTGPNFVADKVIQTGDALFGSTVVDVAFGNEGLNDSMQVAFLALLADGSSVVARADLPGSTQANALLPSLALPGGGFAFVDVQSGLWFDPPIVDSFLYHMTSSSLFTKILDFPTGFAGPFDVLVGNNLLGSFGPGQSVDFLALLGRGVTDFTIRGISPMVDAQNPLAFPLRLEFNTPLASFTMTPIIGPSTAVPEPSALVLTATGVVGLGLIARRRWSRSTRPRGLVT